MTAESPGYGRYAFRLASDAPTWTRTSFSGCHVSYDAAYTHREIDIELTRWGEAQATENFQFVVQPHFAAGHRTGLPCLPEAYPSTHSFTGGPSCGLPEPASGLTGDRAWRFADAPLPHPPANEQVHLNLWLLGGQLRRMGQEVEVVLDASRSSPGAWALARRPSPSLWAGSAVGLHLQAVGTSDGGSGGHFPAADGSGLSITVTAAGTRLAPATSPLSGKAERGNAAGVVA